MRIALLIAFAALIGGAADGAPLTYDAALILADQDAPSLAAKTIEVRAAQSSSIAAGRLPDPKLGFGFEDFPISGPTGGAPAHEPMAGARVSVMQDVPSHLKRQSARERAAADIGAAQASRAVEARNVRLAAALAWIDLYYAKRRLDALDEVDRALAPLRGSAHAQEESGSMRPAQTLESQQLTAVLADRRADLVAAAAKARAELGRWVGDPAAETTGDPPDLTLDPAVLRAGLDRHPSVMAYNATGRQADADLNAAIADKYPEWSWELGYLHRDPRFGDMVSIGATVSLPLFASTRQDPIIAARTEEASRVRLDREATRRELAASLEGDLADLTLRRERLKRAEGTLVPLAKQRASLETASYAAGNASLSDVLQSFLALAEARVDTVDRAAEVERDVVRINLTYEAADQ